MTEKQIISIAVVTALFFVWGTFWSFGKTRSRYLKNYHTSDKPLERIIVYGELYSSKNSRRIWRPKGGGIRVVKSAKARKQYDELVLQLKSHIGAWRSMVKAMEIFMMFQGVALPGKTIMNMKLSKPPSVYPLWISFNIYRSTRRLFDYTNIIQNLLDAMVQAGYIEDDNMNFVIPVFSPYSVDSKCPRCEIKLNIPYSYDSPSRMLAHVGIVK